MTNPLEIREEKTLQFMALFANADGFYISARRALKGGWAGAGLSNAHMALELYLKGILNLTDKVGWGHDLVSLLETHREQDPVFAAVLDSPAKREFLSQLSEAYLKHRYGEAIAHANLSEIINLLDELAYTLRCTYISTIKYPSCPIYAPDHIKRELLEGNAYFTEKDITSSPFALLGFPEIKLPGQ